ncbi:MAG: ASKHA domain-containing protein, partial [Candidatus Latescibacterota bacterium]|nr:ASKHA domain-containing protein [Candidatus Latescibacterota bacterium]
MTGTIRNPGGERRRATSGKTIFDYADELAVQVPTSCYRTGHCHECVVEIRQGIQALAPRTEAESFLRHEYRLACQAVIEDAEVDLLFAPLRRKPKILAVSAEKDIELDPVVSRRGDEVLYDGEVIDRFRGHLYGLAIDLGTTTVVMDLVDLESGRSLHVSSFENPQRFGGSDIMNRISYDGGQDARGELQRSVVSAINFEILEMARLLDFTRQEIYEIAVAGNSTMRDLLFKLDVQGIGQRPYKSLVELEYLAGERSSTSLVQIARRLGLRANLKTRVYGLPLIASHVGADTAAALVALDMDSRSEDAVVVVDVGTNTEVVVGKGERLVAASCPAGPAFEGGGAVKFGMPGYEGAIESFRLDSGGREFAYSTIGDTDPQGICGSGLIDLLAELRRSDRLTAKGVFTEDKKLFEIDIVPEAGITLSKEDISNLAQAKAANYCGQYIVMRKL